AALRATVPAAAATVSAPAAPDAQPTAQPSLGAPAGFQQNVGQVSDPAQLFVARGPNYAFSLAATSATLAIQPVPAAGTEPGTPAVVQMQFVGANPGARADGVDPQS